MNLSEQDTRFFHAVQSFWNVRKQQQQKQETSGTADAGTRGAVTGGAQMAALEQLVVDVLLLSGLNQLDIRTKTALELPGYYRPEKQWDLLVVSQGQLVTAIEFKSQVGPSFGNNFNNRVEEALGNATDFWTAYREGRFGTSPRPFLGYFFLLEDCDKVHRPVRNEEPYFKVDPFFQQASYSKRYEILCRRLVLERVYDAVCLTLSTNEATPRITHSAEDLSFRRFVAELQGSAYRFLRSRERTAIPLNDHQKLHASFLQSLMNRDMMIHTIQCFRSLSEYTQYVTEFSKSLMPSSLMYSLWALLPLFWLG